ncbi:SGNH/GDSL hydrolase family protein [Edaphobacter modestus]|uniref:GDSL-like lipase/acylhydrolase family protein n=1 Tax=Edaphobacter modestus TaxID=388466 RepID=A0A4Q7XZ12_9BACT|nr:SGNH/GDSL hydrolase family protein [Edaphobacter modestus]RZU29031.1 hypothetical protein BDD14_6625 [Edaphobacter modestus]
MTSLFRGDERKLHRPDAEFWLHNHIPPSPLNPRLRFLRWMHTDSEENFRLRGSGTFTEEDVGYSFNELGYRCDEILTSSEANNVVFLGDSHTFGVGLPVEVLWTSRVARKLEERWDVPIRQVNLGWGGTGSDFTSMLVHQTVELLKPRLVCILWSFVCRLSWFPEANRQVFFLPRRLPFQSIDDHNAYLHLATDSHGFYNYVRNFHFVNDRLRRLGIPFVWGHLEQFSHVTLSKFLPLDGFAGCWRAIDLARDNLHGGPDSHRVFADLIYERIAQVENNRT